MILPGALLNEDTSDVYYRGNSLQTIPDIQLD
jgi:hypothetical protein